MNRKIYLIILAILLLTEFVTGQQQNGSVFENRVTINQINQPINSILDQISWQAGVYFSYNASLLDSNKKYSIEATDKSLFTILNQLFDPSEFEFIELENQVIISKKNEETETRTILKDTIPVKYFFLTGKIVDSKKLTPIKFASVSLLNKPIGTITNSDGNFLLKIHPDYIKDSVVISSMGCSQQLLPAYKILDEDEFVMSPISIRIKEIKIVATTPEKLLENIRNNIINNYCNNTKLMTAFYRETVKQDNDYISVSEAVIELLKAPYLRESRSDIVRVKKGRRSPDVKPFQWLNFKLQGGPFTITKLDVVKTLETFISKESQHLYDYNISKVIRYNQNPVYVLEFKPVESFNEYGYEGEMFVHQETFAILHINFQYSKAGLKIAQNTLIKKKPKGVKVRPVYSDYEVNYLQYQNKWHLANVKASVKFKVRSRKDRLNSEYHSVSDMLVTNIEDTELRRFEKKEAFSQQDIFVEIIDSYDPGYWENYNIIKPDEELQNAFKSHPFK